MSESTKPSRGLNVLWIWNDLFVALSLVVTLGAYLSVSEDSAGPFLVSSAFGLAAIGYVLGCVIACTVWTVRRRRHRAGASVTKAVTFVLLLGPCAGAGDYIHLALYYPAYQREIETRGAGNTKPVRFDWGDKALWVTDGMQEETLVYDPTDALAAKVGEVRGGDKGSVGLATWHLIGHFYVELEFSN